MRLTCPFCGERDSEEFQVLGAAVGPRPNPRAEDAAAQFHAYVNLRENPAGPHREHWYHGVGCRRWLVVTRDTRDHTILDIVLAAP